MTSTAGKTIKCRAAVAWEVNKPLSIEEIEVDPPRAHEVRVRLAATGLCHSDISVLNGSIQVSNKFPLILGHEGAGVVESIGQDVTKFKPGDHVIILFSGQCFECDYCKNPKTNLCQRAGELQPTCVMADGTARFKCRGQSIHHFMTSSTFTEYTVVPDFSLTKINKKAPLEKVCLLGCGISTGYGAAINSAKVEPGSSCAVWGLGAIGLATVMGCRKAGASKIYGIDINPEKFQIAKQFGCTDFLNPLDYEGQNMADVLKEITNNVGFDYTFECIGNVEIIRTAIDASHRAWGKTTIVGVAPFNRNLEIFPFDIICGRSIIGTFFGGWKSVESIPKIVDEYLAGGILIDEFVTDTLKLDEINKGLNMMGKDKNIRTVILF